MTLTMTAGTGVDVLDDIESVPAIDHHSHAAYSREGEAPPTPDEQRRHYALGHLEARIPHDAYLAFVEATREGDTAKLGALDAEFETERVLAEGIDANRTTVFDIALTEGDDELTTDAPAAETPRERYDRAMDLVHTPAVLTDVPYIDREIWDPQRYAQIIRIDPYLAPFGPEPYAGRGSDTPRFRRVFDRVLRDELAADGSATPATLADFEAFARASLERRVAEGAVGLKIAAAYTRSLAFLPRERAVAADAYAQLAKGASSPVLHRIVSDHMVYALSEVAAEAGLPVQVHVGMGHNEPGLVLSDAHPLNLEPWLGSPQLNRLPVVLIHGGYPYGSELCALAMSFGNVHLDYSWMPYLHHDVMRRMLEEWLQILPANRLMYGTDTGAPELHVSATRRARAGLAAALASGHRDGLWTATMVEALARRVLADNVRSLYALS